jgi:hypothetical protein
MDHSYIEGAGLIDRYVRGRMPVDERVAFEEHFLDCQECLEQLEMARSFMEGLKITATEAADRPKPARPPFGAWLTAWAPWRTAGLVAASALIVLAVPVALLMRQLADTRGELGREKRASMALQDENARHLAAIERQFATTQQVSPAVFVLNEVRGLDTTQAGPANRITIPKSPRFIVFAIERDFSQYRTYRVAIQNRDGKTVWQQDHLQPSSPDALGISIPSIVLSPGDYAVSISALKPSGQDVPLAKYSFRAVE